MYNFSSNVQLDSLNEYTDHSISFGVNVLVPEFTVNLYPRKSYSAHVLYSY